MTDTSQEIPVLTIDGPSGSGKGAVGRALASRLGWHFLDSGALYRILALAVLDSDLDPENDQQLTDLINSLKIEFPADGSDAILLNGKDVSTEIRSEACGDQASQLAARPLVREALLQAQRDFSQSPGLVADGRDMGTVVFPAATLKIFLTASAEERARRRYNQLKEKGLSASLSTLCEEIEARDHRDANRPVAPLKPADDAIQVDSTTLAINEVSELVMHALQDRLDD